MRLNDTGRFCQQSGTYRGSAALDVVVRFNLLPQAAEASKSKNTDVETADVFIRTGFQEAIWMLSQDNPVEFARFSTA